MRNVPHTQGVPICLSFTTANIENPTNMMTFFYFLDLMDQGGSLRPGQICPVSVQRP